ncbi:MAG: DUF1499 domain-containing protein [Bryobacterales bacterium]
MSWILWLIVALAAFAVVYAGLKGRKPLLALVYGPVVRKPVDFETLELAKSPNQYLVCPPGLCHNAKPNAESPVFDMTPEDLRARWMARIGKLPRVEQIGADAERLQYDYETLTPFFNFPDTVTVRFLPAGEGKSTLAIYSRSHYGYSDLGVNEKRVKDWLERLK